MKEIPVARKRRIGSESSNSSRPRAKQTRGRFVPPEDIVSAPRDRRPLTSRPVNDAKVAPGPEPITGKGSTKPPENDAANFLIRLGCKKGSKWNCKNKYSIFLVYRCAHCNNECKERDKKRCDYSVRKPLRIWI